MRNLCLWLCQLNKLSRLAVSHAENRVKRLAYDLAYIDLALVGAINRLVLGMNDAMVARVVYHHKEIILLYHIY